MAMYLRGGRPQHFVGVTANGGTPQEWNISAGKTMQFIINNVHATTVLTLYLTEDAMTAGEGFDIQPGYGHSMPVEIDRFWVYSAAAAGSFQAVALVHP